MTYLFQNENCCPTHNFSNFKMRLPYVQWQDNLWQVLCHDGSKHYFNRIWLATGTKFNVTEHPLLQDVLEAYPTEILEGLPILDEHLRLPKSNFFIMGGLAALRIGPVARNIGGGKMACQRIVPAIVKSSLAIE